MSCPPGRPSARTREVGACDQRGIVYSQRCGQLAVARPERGKRILAEGNDRHAEGLEHLKRCGKVQNRLRARGDDADWGLRQALAGRRRRRSSRLAPRWTPPIPPVANTSILARRAMIIVAATVVAPVAPEATQTARSARDSFRTDPPLPKRSSASRSRPTRSSPSSTAIVAGTAPPARMVSSTANAVSMFPRIRHPVADNCALQGNDRFALALRCRHFFRTDRLFDSHRRPLSGHEIRRRGLSRGKGLFGRFATRLCRDMSSHERVTCAGNPRHHDGGRRRLEDARATSPRPRFPRHRSRARVPRRDRRGRLAASRAVRKVRRAINPASSRLT